MKFPAEASVSHRSWRPARQGGDQAVGRALPAPCSHPGIFWIWTRQTQNAEKKRGGKTKTTPALCTVKGWRVSILMFKNTTACSVSLPAIFLNLMAF